MQAPTKIWDEWKQEGYEAKVLEPRLDETRRTVWVETELNFVLPFGAAQKREEEMSKLSIEQGYIVRFIFKYKDIVQPPEVYVPRLIAEFIYRRKAKFGPAIKSVQPENISVDGDQVQINTRGEFFAKLLNDNAGKELEDMLASNTDKPFQVNFVPSDDVSAKGGKIGDTLVYIYSPHTFEHQYILKAEDDINKRIKLQEFKQEKQKIEEKIEALCKNGKNNCKSKKKRSLQNTDSSHVDSNGDEADPKVVGKASTDKTTDTAKESGVETSDNTDGKENQPSKLTKGYIIFGKVPTKQRVTNIEDVRYNRNKRENIVIEGTIYDLGIKPRFTRNGKRIVLEIWVHDRSGAILAKHEFSEEKWKSLPGDKKKRLTKGAYVRISGITKLDTEPHYTEWISVKGVVELQKPERKDASEEKRVELHAHTKMSPKDALNDVEGLISRAADWGHPAVAITDHGGVQAFPEAANAVNKLEKNGKSIKVLYGVEGYLFRDEAAHMNGKSWDLTSVKPDHIIIIAKNEVGLKNLYKLISQSHINYFYKKPLMPRSIIEEHREGLIIGSACEAGEVFRGIVAGYRDEELLEIAKFYDYLEIQPLINNNYLIGIGKAEDEEGLKEFNKKVVELGDALGKPVVATCDTHYMEPEDKLYRRILMSAQGYEDLGVGGLYFRTTDEMLEEFSYLGKEKAREVVIENTQKIASRVDKIKPIPDGKYPPRIEGADEPLRESCYGKAREVYGDPLPEEIQNRLDAELEAVIGEGYAVMYVSAQMLVDKAREAGYVVGSRGSVGSSFAATMAGITEVNPLPPHYVCPDCKYLEWGDLGEYDCGVDMPAKKCPKCGADLNRDGYNIPFETFLGNEDSRKEPDIDLNFPSEYQETAQKYVDEIFGAKNVYKAGTITTIKDKTAYGYARDYAEKVEGDNFNYAVTKKNAYYCEGVRTSSGQHAGGIIVLPDNMEIEDFCPVQRPGGNKDANFITTHFDYHAIDSNLLKLDILGHDVPSIIRHLYDMTGVDPMKVPLQDEGVQALFLGKKSLKLKPRKGKKETIIDVGTFGIPEFGTAFVRKMLKVTKPQCMGDLIRISGFSHGTDVWTNNAETFIKSNKATIKDAISTRDDIMNYLKQHGMPSAQAFKIMEKVRKGRGLTPEEEAEMRKLNVPSWYIESCKLIQYLFPKAHAVAYVSMAYRIGYFKVYYPEAFYAAYLTTKVKHFRWDLVKQGGEAVVKALDRLYSVPSHKREQSDKDEISVLEICYEMYRRGIEFEPPSMEASDATTFNICQKDGETRVIVPIWGIPQIGPGTACKLKASYEERPFATIEDVVKRGGVDKTALEILQGEGFFKDLPETEQIGFSELK